MKINLKKILILIIFASNIVNCQDNNNKPIFKHLKCEKINIDNTLINFVWNLEVIIGYTISISQKLSINRKDLYSLKESLNFESIAIPAMHEISLFRMGIYHKEFHCICTDTFNLEDSIRKIERYELIKHFARLINKLSKVLPNRYRYTDYHVNRLLKIIDHSEQYLIDIAESLKQHNVEQFIIIAQDYIDELVKINLSIK